MTVPKPANCLLPLRRFDQARAELQKVISLDPKSPIAEQARQALGGAPGNT